MFTLHPALIPSSTMKLPPKESFELDPLPLLSPCYCGQCKKPLTASRVMDDSHAWCPRCKSIVTTSWFQVPSWVMGGTVLTYAIFTFWL